MVAAAVHHEVALRTPSFAGKGGAPLLLERVDEDFLPAIFDELRSEAGRSALLDTTANTRDKQKFLKLFQPVHRTFHIAVLEAVCLNPGLPRIDPRKVDSAGIVVRRIENRPDVLERLRRSDRELRYGWMRNGNDIQGWVPLPSESDEDLDPDLERRRPVARSANPEINRRLLASARSNVPTVRNESPVFHEFLYTETSSPAFTAPPDVCQDAAQTFLFGVVPLTTGERNELAPPPRLTDEEILSAGHYPSYFRQGGARALPLKNTTLTLADINAPDLASFVGFIRQLAFEFGYEEDTEYARNLRAVIDSIDFDGFPAGGFVQRAINFFLRQSTTTFNMPGEWPAIDRATADALLAAVRDALQERLATLAPREGRYDDTSAVYRLRMFVRMKPEQPNCPPRLIWSGYSEPFRVAPWYDSNALVPPVSVALPDVTSANAKDFKPNVAFQVPPRLQDLFGNSTDDFLDGKAGEKNSGFDLMWICSFSLPIITLCAFIVLNIFLQLFNIIFQWMFYIKICLPIPRKR